jgi:hypothetical protein
MPEPCFLLFYRSEGESVIEQLVDAARAATLRDTAQRADEAGFERIIIATTDATPFESLPGVEIDLNDSGGPFAPRLRAVLEGIDAGPICYAGSGMPGYTVAAWRALRLRVEAGETVANNLYSADVLATPEAAPLLSLPDDARDNGMALWLRDEADVEVTPLPRSAAALLDIDTPADLRILALADSDRSTGTKGFDLGAELHQLLLKTDVAAIRETGVVERALELLTERESEMLVIGRVGSAVWQALERETASRIRVISEERGMRARPDGQARSLVGFHLGAVGPEELVASLEELGEAVFFDTRPLFAHLDWHPSRADRFWSDAGVWEEIEHPELRAFTKAVANSRVPFVLGGHSLVSGGLLAAIDIAWSRWESSA